MPMNDVNAEMTIDGMRRARAIKAFAKDIARQCVEIDRRQRTMPKMVIRNGCVMTEDQEKHYDTLIAKAKPWTP